ncbi:MAG TPA: hypothetical protein PLQ88_19105, partial [Blastocatellia bacterium]|nr:hypothetical protein [Blastocatellia bacterium]
MKHTITRQTLAFSFALCLMLLTAATASAQGTAFTHQGRLTDNGAAANGLYDLQFAVFDAVSAGTQQGATLTLDDVQVTGGVFTVTLDFGTTPFNGAARWLQISVRPGANTGAFTVLTPRQPLSATPYAIRALNATTADTATNAAQLGGIAANQYVTGPVVGNVNGLSGSVTLAAGANVTLTPSGNTLTIAATGGSGGAGNAIQNSTAIQPNANFNISGNGTAGGTLSGNAVNAALQFNLNGNRILSNAGDNNLFAGVGAAASNTGGYNTFFGSSAGAVNSSGGLNAFFGSLAGASNTTAGNNAFFGSLAGTLNTTGGFNTFLGMQAGFNNTMGTNNAFVGTFAGVSNVTGSNNTLLGSNANVSSDGLSYATAIGAGATVDASNTITLGRSNGSDAVRIPGTFSLGSGSNFIRHNPVNGSNDIYFGATNNFVWYLKDTQLMALTYNELFVERDITSRRTISAAQDVGAGGRVSAGRGFVGKCTNNDLTWGGYCNQDLAETFRTKEQTEPGDVVTLIPKDHERPTVRRAQRAYDEHLVGVVSSNPGLVFDEGNTKLAGANDQLITKDKTVVAAVGRVPVKFTLENGAINVGDALTSSATEPGKAMKATGAGKIIGIALESSAKAKEGKLLMWLQVGYHAPAASVTATAPHGKTS